MSNTTSFPFHPSIPRVGDPIVDVRPTESYLWHDAVADNGELITVATYAYGLLADLDDFDPHRWDTPFEDRKVVVTGLTGDFVDMEIDPDLHRFWFDLTDDLDFPMGITAEDYEDDFETIGSWSDRRRVTAAYLDALRAVRTFYRNRPLGGDSPWLTADEADTYHEALEVLRDGLGIYEDTVMTDDDLINAAIEDYNYRDDCCGLLETIPEVEYSLVPALRDIARSAWARVQECDARLRRESDNEEWRESMSNIDRAAEIIERATRGAHTTGGHPMKMSYHTARIIAEALADDGMLMPDDATTQTETVGPYFPEQECDAR